MKAAARPGGRSAKGRSERPRAHSRDGKRIVLPRGYPRHRRRHGGRAIRRVETSSIAYLNPKTL